MKKNRNDYELLLESLSRMQEEKASVSLELELLRKEMAAMRESYEHEIEELRKRFETNIETLLLTNEDLRRQNEEKNADFQELKKLLANAQADGKLARKRRFAPTTEQRRLLNNRSTDWRSEEKDDFDGTPPSAPAASSQQSDVPTAPKKKKSLGRRPSKENYDCDEVVRHPLGSYFKLPEGCRFKTRNGETEIHEAVEYEYIPGRIVKHVYETATYMDADGVSHNTKSETKCETPVKGCPYSPQMLSFILTEKYAYHTPKNRIKKKLREMGVNFSKTTLNRYFQAAETILREEFGQTLHNSVMDSKYLMIDETCELVGVENKDGSVKYLKRYLWAFYDKASSLVSYLYEQGSRAREVILKALQGFSGSFTSDGYAAYIIFDKDDHPHILHCGCWSHVRRYIIEAMDIAPATCRQFLSEIDTLFLYERDFKDLDAMERKIKRERLSLHVLNRIFAMANRVAADTEQMGKDRLKKAVNYMRNQEQTLRNFILDGNVEISNNLVEQRMKPIKLSLKNCQNIGSERAAQNAAFMHSIIESCRLHDKKPYDYLLALFKKVGKALDDSLKRAFMPDVWVPEC